MEILLSILIIEDSWQTHRIHNALKGVPEDKDGLLDTINRAKNHYQKRAYQCIKCMVALFSRCATAQKMLHTHADLKRQWILAVNWLQEEMERKYPQNSQYTYSTWSPPAQSNENSSGYFLERSSSARKTLERALELMPESEREEEYLSEREEEYLSEKEAQDDSAEVQGEGSSDMPDITQSCESTSNP